MGNCCNNNLFTEESRFSISIDKQISLVDIQPLPIVITESSEESNVLIYHEKQKSDGLVSEKETCAGVKEDNSFITGQTHDNTDYKCLCGSRFIWRSDIVFWHYENFSDWNIHCDFCLNYFSKSAWQCYHCGKIMCRDCGSAENMNPQIEYCINSHELLWSPNSSAYYSQEYKKTSYKCMQCKKSRCEASWSCRECEYDLCLHCGIKKNLIPPKNLLICDEKKILVHKKKSDIPFICSKCNDITNKNSYYCSSCDYSICGKCSGPLLSTITVHPGLKCRKNHDLKTIKIDSVKKKSGKWYICMKCDNISMNYGYLCTICCECYCLGCGDQIVKAVSDFSGVKCGKGHNMFWEPSCEDEDEGDLCNVCCKRIYCGSFKCKECEISVCVDDISRIN
ncbi:hypothetical protein SteCoe_31634 [Stentor coeruleus]|uniref:Uncharacterized protein n=1 Tax=Stentor coeruleus TaxID=5963 RepID=A0A1R2B0V0_9CILI|nr:hypothetical protein SteCoe_31634 [Stentor coeruleus]